MIESEAEKVREDARRQRTVIGLFLAPFLGSTMGATAFVMLAMAQRWPAGGSAWSMVGDALATFTPVALQLSVTVGLPTSFLIGFPLHVLLNHYRLNGWLSYACAGAASAIIGTTAFLYFIGVRSGWSDGVSLLSFIVFAGASASLSFWLIRRPDKDVRLNHSGSNST